VLLFPRLPRWDFLNNITPTDSAFRYHFHFTASQSPPNHPLRISFHTFGTSIKQSVGWKLSFNITEILLPPAFHPRPRPDADENAVVHRQASEGQPARQRVSYCRPCDKFRSTSQFLFVTISDANAPLPFRGMNRLQTDAKLTNVAALAEAMRVERCRMPPTNRQESEALAGVRRTSRAALSQKFQKDDGVGSLSQ
jgi:hypothetical protein